MEGPVVLLPPSEAKAVGGGSLFTVDAGVFASLAPCRRRAIDALAAASTGDTASTALGVRGDLLERARAALAALAAGRAPAMEACERYTGVVWTHLDPGTLEPGARRRIVVPSALTGLAAGTDPVPDYRGRFSSVVAPLGRLDRWWRPALTETLAAEVAGQVVVDLLPEEHAAAIDWSTSTACSEVVSVRFVTHGGRRAAGHAAKAAKGVSARVALTEGIDALDGFEWSGWTIRRDDAGFVATAPGS